MVEGCIRPCVGTCRLWNDEGMLGWTGNSPLLNGLHRAAERSLPFGADTRTSTARQWATASEVRR